MNTNFNIEFNSDAGNLNAGIASIQSNLNKLSESWQSQISNVAQLSIAIKNVYAGLQKVADAARQPFNDAMDFEWTATRMAPLLGGMKQTRAFLKDIRKQAANGTASFDDLAKAAQTLSGAFKDREQLQQWVQAVHNLSATSGQSAASLAAMIATAKESGRNAGSILNSLAASGINIYEILSEKTGIAARELSTMARSGSLDFKTVERAILDVATGTGKLAGQAAALSGTLKGTIETAQATARNFASDAAETALDYKLMAVPAFLAVAAGIGKIAVASGAARASLNLMKTAAVGAAKTMRANIGATVAVAGGELVAWYQSYVNKQAAEMQATEEANRRMTEQYQQRLKLSEDAIFAATSENEALETRKKLLTDLQYFSSGENDFVRTQRRMELEERINEAYDKQIANLKEIAKQETSAADAIATEEATKRAKDAREAYDAFIQTQALAARTTAEQLEYLEQKIGANSTAIFDQIFALKQKAQLTEEESAQLREQIGNYQKLTNLERQIANERKANAEAQKDRQASFDAYKLNLQIRELQKAGNTDEADRLRLIQRQNELRQRYGEMANGYAERELALEKEGAKIQESKIQKYARLLNAGTETLPGTQSRTNVPTTSLANIATGMHTDIFADRIAKATEASARILEKIESKTGLTFTTNTTLA